MNAYVIFKNKLPDLKLIRNKFEEILLVSLKPTFNASFVPSFECASSRESLDYLSKIPGILDATAIIFSDEDISKETASRFAFKYGLGIIAHVVDFEINSGYVVAIVHSFENLRLKISGKSRPTVFIMTGEELLKEEKSLFLSKEIMPTTIEVEKDKSYELKNIKPHPENNLLNAKIIFGVGLGVPAMLIPRVYELAKCLNAPVVCTRPVSDLGYMDRHYVVGDTGIKINPALYIALGISGATQHLSGVRAKKIIAVNSDPNAPIFNVADIKINMKVEDIIEELLIWAKGF